MKTVVNLFGLLITLAGISLLFYPHTLLEFLENNVGSLWLYIVAIAVRLVIGLIFVTSARESKYPRFIKGLGYLFIIAAVVFILIGHSNFQDFFTSLIPDVTPYAPIGGLLALALGAFLIYSFADKKELDEAIS